jgi:uncharacterized Ntn-hydrolase superfamily protein
VATQSWIDPGYGPRCLELLAAGVEPAAALEQVRASDELAQERQVGPVSVAGDTASFTGDCLPETSSVAGDGFTAQANLMISPGVCDAMAEAYETATHRAGGDARGQMSAAVLVVDSTRREHPWKETLASISAASWIYFRRRHCQLGGDDRERRFERRLRSPRGEF